MRSFDLARRATEKYYDGSFTAWGPKEEVVNNVTEVNPEALLVNGARGRIVQKPRAGSSATRPEDAPVVIYETKLLTAPEHEIPIGARVDFTQDRGGKVTSYVRAAEGFTSYLTHQELTLIRNTRAIKK